MSFLKKIFKTVQYEQIVICNYCDSDCEAHKKCDNCSEKICVECYKEHKMCYSCDQEYEKWARSLQKINNEKTKKTQYNIENKSSELTYTLI
jgi:hypothetical protein